MPSLLKAARKTSRKSNSSVNRPQPTVPIKITAATKSGSVLTITYDQVVSLNGVPKYVTTVAGADAISAAQTGPTTVAITFDAAITAATAFTIPYEEPAVRNSSGGFVSTSTFPVA